MPVKLFALRAVTVLSDIFYYKIPGFERQASIFLLFLQSVVDNLYSLCYTEDNIYFNAGMTMKSNHFYKKLLKLFLVISIVPTIIIGVITAFSSNHLAEKRLITEAQKTNAQCLTSIENILDTYLSATKALGETEIVNDILSSPSCASTQKTQFYEKIYSLAPKFPEAYVEKGARSFTVAPIADVHLINNQNKEILSLNGTPDNYNLETNGNWGFYRKARETRDSVIYFSAYTSASGTETAATSIQALYNDKKLQGFLAMEIPTELLKDQTTNNGDMLPLHFSLITGDNYIVWNDANLSSTASFLSDDVEFTQNSGYQIYPDSDTRQLFVYQYSSKYNIYIVGSFNLELILGGSDTIIYIWVVAAVLITLFCILTAIKVTHTVTHPLQILTSSMSSVEQGNLDVEISLNDYGEFGYVAKQFNFMCRRIKELFQKNQEKQELLRIAELKRLQSQINPHFLYNTLDSIKSLAKLNGEEKIFIMTKNLNTLLKKSFRISKEFTTLSESLKDLSAYIAIQQIRFPDKFSVHMEIPAKFMSCSIPSLVLQPLVENAILHGLEPLPGKGDLIISAFQRNDDLILTVKDKGVGMNPEQVQELLITLENPESSSHIGLRNVHQRLRLYYGEHYGLSLTSTINTGTSITITIPFRKE